MRTSPQTAAPLAEVTATVQQPMKVCMVLLWPLRDNYYYYIMRRASALIEAGFAVSVVDVEHESTQSVEENIQGIRVKHMIAPDWFIPRKSGLWAFVKGALMTIRSIVLLLQTDADIYHAYTEQALPACYLAARLRRKPLVFDSPEMPLEHPSYTSRSWLYAFATRFLATLLPRCAGIITVSPPIAEEIRSRYHIPEVTVLRNVPIYRAVSRSNRLRQYLGLSANVRILLYQGYLLPERGLDRLVRVAPYLESNIVIVIMGNDYLAGTRARLEALIASEGVTERVKIIPAVPYDELLDWTASADIGLNILPLDYSLSIRWCLPNKFFEYLMAGLPVLSSPLDAVAEIIRTYDVGQVLSSLEPADIGAAINAMLADSAGLERMKRNALGATKREFRWENESQQLIRLYHKILAKQSKQRSG